MGYELIAECLGVFPLHMFKPKKDDAVLLQKMRERLQIYAQLNREQFFEIAEVFGSNEDETILVVHRQGRVFALRIVCWFGDTIKIYAEVVQEENYMLASNHGSVLYLVYNFTFDADDQSNSAEDTSFSDC